MTPAKAVLYTFDVDEGEHILTIIRDYFSTQTRRTSVDQNKKELTFASTWA